MRISSSLVLAVGARAENVDRLVPLELLAQRRDIHEGPQENPRRRLGVGHRPGAVGRGDDERLAAEPIGRVVFRRVTQIEALDGQPAPFAAEHDLIRGDLARDLASVLDLGAGDHFAGAGGQGMHDRGRRAEHVDDDDGPAQQFLGLDQFRQGVNV